MNVQINKHSHINTFIHLLLSVKSIKAAKQLHKKKNPPENVSIQCHRDYCRCPPSWALGSFPVNRNLVSVSQWRTLLESYSANCNSSVKQVLPWHLHSCRTCGQQQVSKRRGSLAEGMYLFCYVLSLSKSKSFFLEPEWIKKNLFKILWSDLLHQLA